MSARQWLSTLRSAPRRLPSRARHAAPAGRRLASVLPACLALALLLASRGDRYEVSWWTRGQPAPLPAGREALRVGVDASYPPFASVAADGSLRGLEVDVAGAIAARLGLPIQLVNTDAGNGLDALPAGAFDAILAGLTAEPELLDLVRFSPSYFDAGPVLLERADGPGTRTGLRVLVEAGSPWSDVRALLRGQRVKTTWDLDVAVQDVLAGRSDAVLVDRATALERIRDVGNGRLTLTLPVAPEACSAPLLLLRLVAPAGAVGCAPGRDQRAQYGYRVAMSRANRSLALSVDRAVTELRASGALARLERRWFGSTDGR